MITDSAAAPYWRLWMLIPAILCLLSLPRDVHSRRALISVGAGTASLASSDCEPTEVHLSLSEADGDMRVAWRTASSGCPSTVSYGRADRAASRLASASAPNPLLQSGGSGYTISEDLMCESPAKKKPFNVHMHTALMTGLDPDTEYEYSLGGSDARFRLRTPRRVGSERFSFIAFGDMGESKIKQRKCSMAAATVDTMRREVEDRPVDLILHIGDLAYADGKYKVWDSFMSQIQPLASRLPYMVGIGNHEAGPCKAGASNDPSGERPYDPSWGNYGPESGGECGAMTAHRFLMPGTDLASRGPVFAAAAAAAAAATPAAAAQRRRLSMDRPNPQPQLRPATGAVADGGDDTDGADGGSDDGPAAVGAVSYDSRLHHNPPFWYSFDAGPVHFTVLSTEHDLTEGSSQRAWLAADLAGVDRCATPWLVVALHRPMYVVYPHKDNRVVGEHIRDSIEELLIRHRVDLTISGHVHAYYRSCAAAGYKCVDDPRDGVTHLTIGTGGHELSAVEDDQKSWCDEVVNDFGFGRFDVDGDTLRFSFIRSEDGEAADSFKLRSKVAPGDACSSGLRGEQRGAEVRAGGARLSSDEGTPAGAAAVAGNVVVEAEGGDAGGLGAVAAGQVDEDVGEGEEDEEGEEEDKEGKAEEDDAQERPRHDAEEIQAGSGRRQRAGARGGRSAGTDAGGGVLRLGRATGGAVGATS